MQIYWDERKFFYIRKEFNSTQDWFGTSMAAVSLFWDTNMTDVTLRDVTLRDVTSSEKAL